MRFQKKYRFLSLAIFLAAIFSSALCGQTSAGLGTVSGVVTDPNGATIAGAEVVVENSEMGIRRALKTTSGGLFNASALVPHSGYTVTVDAPGFAQFTDRDLTLHVGQDLSLPVQMEVKSSTTKIDVVDEAPLVDQTKTDVSSTIDEHQINNLPINGRRVDQFVLLTPGVTPDGTFGDISFRGKPGGNTFLVDGNDTTDQFYGENAGRTRIQTQISQDAVQEFQVLSDGYSAEYGRAIGGVINTVTRSGTNQYHASGFWYFRNRTLDARDPFTAINPPEVRNQFGGNISGPIVKDKLFFFGNTEEHLRDFPLVSSLISPSNISGSGPSAKWKNCGVAIGGLPAATASECGVINGLLPQFFTTLPRTQSQQTALLKIDYRPDEKNAFSASLNYMHFNSPNGIQTGAVVTNGGALNSNGIDDVGVRMGRAQWTLTPNGSMVNESRFGWFKDRQADALNNAILPSTGAVSISVNGVAVGAPNYLPRVAPSENRFEYADNFSYTQGRHNFKFGVDYLNTEDFYNELNNSNGSYSFTSPNAFALAYAGAYPTAYSSFSQAFGNPIVDTTLNDVAAFAQDQYRVRPNLTLYYGIRYEKSFLPQPLSAYVNAAYPQTGKIAQDNLNFAPRVGFAWGLNDNRTVVRAGFGVMYDRYPTALINTLFSSNNNYVQNYTLTPGVTSASALPAFPNVLTGVSGLKASGGANIEFAAPDFRVPYTEQGDFGIQQSLGSKTSLTASYMWDRGARIFTVRDVNQPALPDKNVTYNLLNSQGGSVIGSYSTPVYLGSSRLNSSFNRILEVDNGGNSYYNGLAVQLTRRLQHGFEAGVTYTWSHAIDDNLGGSSNFTYISSVSSSLLNGDYQGVKGDSSLDQRQRLAINWVWAPTLSHSDSTLARYTLNGWRLTAVTTVATGLPYTETLANIASYPGLLSSSTLNGFGGSAQVPWLGVNTLRLNDTTRVDARLTKELPFTERFHALLAFEVFNLTNTVTYTSASTIGYDASWNSKAKSGVIYPVAGLGLPTASAGFPDGTNARRAQASLRLDF